MPDPLDGKSFRSRYAAFRSARQERRERFVPLYRDQALAYLSAEGLTPMERLHLFHLLTYASRNGDVKVAIPEMAATLRTTTRTVQLSLRKLEETGWIRRIQYHPNEPAVFFLVPPDEVPAPAPVANNLDA